jgi:hypothetical protein
MASTRNLNTALDYQNEKRKDQQHLAYNTYRGFGVNHTPTLFTNGPNPSIYAGQLDRHAIDVESMLRGIRSTNLEGVSFTATPSPVTIQETTYYEKVPLMMPDPYISLNRERPNYLN